MRTKSYKHIVVNNAFWLAMQTIILKICTFFFSVLLARKLDTYGLGIYSYLITLVSFYFLFAQLGFDTYFLRRWATRTGKAPHEIPVVNTIKLIAAVLIGLGLYLYVALTRCYAVEITVLYLTYILEQVRSTYLTYNNSRNDFKENTYTNVLDAGGSALCGIVLLLLGYGLRELLFAQLVCKALSCLLIILRQKERIPLFTIDLHTSLSFLKASLPFFSLSLFSMIYFRIDVLMLKALTTVTTVGLYNAAYRVMEMANLIPGYIFIAFSPVIMELAHTNRTKLSGYYTRIYKYLLSCGSFVTLMIIVFSKDILLLLWGNSFEGSTPYLQVLAMNIILLFMTMPLVYWLNAVHKEHYVLKVMILLSVTNIVLNFIFIHYWGGVGAAWTTVLCEIINFMLLAKEARMNIIPAELPMIIVSNTLAVTVTYLLIWHTQLHWLLILTAGSLLYCAMLFVSRTFNMKDLTLHT